MKPYSEDLHERVAAVCAEDRRSVGEVAAQFRVSVSFVHKLRRRLRTTGMLGALPHRGGLPPLLDAAARTQLAASVARQLGAILDGTALPTGCQWRTRRGHTTVWKALKTLKLRRKKSIHAAQRGTYRVKGLCRAFLEALLGEDMCYFKFVDEISVNLTYTRRYGWDVGWIRRCHCTTAQT
jgi:transposase